MAALLEPKIDCHNHILDPRHHPYLDGVAYRPAGQEIGTVAQLHAVCDAYRVDHCLVVGPNSGYGEDNRCLLNAVARGKGRFKGVAVVANDVAPDVLRDLKSRGVVGIAINATYHGVDHYSSIGPLIRTLTDLDMFLQIQVEGGQLPGLMPLIEHSDVKLIVDHCGRPDPTAGLMQPGAVALRSLGATGRAAVKLSGLAKFSRQAFPYEDTWPYVRALADSFGFDRCMWGSDWPFLRAAERLDYGPLLTLVDLLFPSNEDRRRLLWETPKRLFGFGTAS
jgi:predicted TIM-barrel fold metal-dependent hydrolase